MVFNQFHFAQTDWLWGLLVIPFIWGLYGFFFRQSAAVSQLEGFVDAHLLPHLLVNKPAKKQSLWQSLAVASFLWALLMGALAGPRWDFKEVTTYKPDQNLVILLDLSQSMNADDVKPSRLIRARQEIEDILTMAKGVKIGLVAFAADPHMITPLTEDMETIRHLLPSLDTELVYVQGSNLTPALDMAKNLLAAEPGHNKSIVVMTDGGFNDASTAVSSAKKLAKQGIVVETMGFGTKVGAPIRNVNGTLIKENGKVVMSHLERDKLQTLGQYINANYTENDSKMVLNQLKARAQVEKNKQQKTRHWEERFYLLILPLMLIMLLGFRKGFAFPVVMVILILPVNPTQAATLEEYFKNEAQQGQEAMIHQDYNKASSTFKDSYRKGVAEYKAGHFAEAERLFATSKRKDILDKANYNLGSALAQQKKFEQAISAYKKVLAHDPDNTKAKDNLVLVKKLLEQKKQQDKQQQNDEKNKQDDQKKNQDKQKKGDSEPDSKDQKDQSEQQKKKDAQNKKDNSVSDNQSKDQQKQENKSDADQKTGEKKQESTKKQTAEEKDKQHDQAKNQSAEQQKAGDEQKPEEAINASEDESQANKKPARTQADIDADQWLNRANNTPKSFLKNQFYIESMRNKTNEGSKPWKKE